jgi:hypothetical protein
VRGNLRMAYSTSYSDFAVGMEGMRAFVEGLRR